MKTGMVRWLVLAMGILVFASCQQNQSVSTSISPVPPARPFVFYDETGDPSETVRALSQDEFRDILNWVAARTSHPVWLIRVRPSTITETRYTVIAYLVPDEATSRIRVGQAYDVPSAKAAATVRPPWKYAQVSLTDHHFGEQLTKPSEREIPFRCPAGMDPNSTDGSSMSKEEAVAAVDCVRKPLNYNEWVARAGVPKYMVVPRILSSPILEMRKNGSRTYVGLGFMHEPLWGHGLTVTLKHTLTGYRIIAWDMWIS